MTPSTMQESLAPALPESRANEPLEYSYELNTAHGSVFASLGPVSMKVCDLIPQTYGNLPVQEQFASYLVSFLACPDQATAYLTGDAVKQYKTASTKLSVQEDHNANRAGWQVCARKGSKAANFVLINVDYHTEALDKYKDVLPRALGAACVKLSLEKSASPVTKTVVATKNGAQGFIRLARALLGLTTDRPARPDGTPTLAIKDEKTNG